MKNIFSHKRDRFAALNIQKNGVSPHDRMNRTVVQNFGHFKESVLAEHRKMESIAAQERGTGLVNVSDMLLS